MKTEELETETATRRSTRRHTYPATPLRVLRLSKGVKLADVAARSGLTLTRCSYIERSPRIATAEELAAIRSAIEQLATELTPVGGAA